MAEAWLFEPTLTQLLTDQCSSILKPYDGQWRDVEKGTVVRFNKYIVRTVYRVLYFATINDAVRAVGVEQLMPDATTDLAIEIYKLLFPDHEQLQFVVIEFD